MKTLKEIINQELVFFNDFSDRIDVLGNFNDIYMDSKEYFKEELPYANASYWLDSKKKSWIIGY